MSKPTNPPLFEVTFNGMNGGVTTSSIQLRDLFAAAALAGFMSKKALYYNPKDDAEYCYGVADAMLAARAQGGSDAE